MRKRLRGSIKDRTLIISAIVVALGLIGVGVYLLRTRTIENSPVLTAIPTVSPRTATTVSAVTGTVRGSQGLPNVTVQTDPTWQKQVLEWAKIMPKNYDITTTWSEQYKQQMKNPTSRPIPSSATSVTP